MFDFLITPTTTCKGRRLIQALADTCPGDPMVQSAQVRPGATLVVYGMGGADRLPISERHMAAGGVCVSWDLGYWQRKGPANVRKMRVSINGMHPQQWVMRGKYPGSRRWDESGLEIRQAGNPKGPVVLVGNGPKSNAIGAATWAAVTSRELRALFPGRQIVYRPKPKRPFDVGVDFDLVDRGPIDDLISGASLVVCRHSNVAVDACRLDVPVACEDGAAAAIYPTLAEWERQPSARVRREFLHRLAWWQWSASEARQAWPWLLRQLDEVRSA